MFVDKPNAIIWNMIKSKQNNNSNNSDSDSRPSTKGKRGSLFLEEQLDQIGENAEPMKIIEKLPTYSKISILQGLLKEMISIKERFDDNKNKMLQKIKKNCFLYYKNKIGMKEIYDYCKSNSPEQHYNYVLVEEAKTKLIDNYKLIYEILFLFRNNNDIIMNIIKNCPENSFDQLADFLVNFFYENTIDSSFNEEELIIIIYLIIEDYFINKLPEIIPKIKNDKKNNKNIFSDSILYEIIKSITRKPDVRNFTCTILSDSILKLEVYKDILSVETNIINNNIMRHSIKYCVAFRIKTIDENKNKNNQPIFNDSNLSLKTKNIDNQEKIDYENIELNSCFMDEDVNMEYLKEKLSKLEQKNNDDAIVIAMKYYINLKIEEIKEENSEIFSNCEKVKILKKYTALNGKEKSDDLINEILKNYNVLTDFIDEVLLNIKDNINSLPNIIKSIYFIMDIIIDKKYTIKKPDNLEFQKFMILSNYLIGNIILPLISNPDFNGIITTCALSKTTKDNLEIITKIINKLITGHLFSNKTEPEYTMFNKYIIKTIPKIFDIIKAINLHKKNYKVSNVIQNLINTCDSLGKPDRNINYDYFQQNKENIQLQSICFSWLDLIILIDLIQIYKESNNKDKKYYEIFEKFIKIRKYCVEKYNENLNNFKKDFFVLEKINYNPFFSKQIENILEDNYLSLMSDEEEDEKVLLFKKCLVEVLTYVNKLHKESFNYFVLKNHENIIKDNDIFSLLLNDITYNNYDDTSFDEDNNDNNENKENNDDDICYNFVKRKIFHSKGLEQNENEDADFKNVIFPQIIDTIKYELGHNLDSDKTKRIVFCSSYLQIHIDDLPQKYKNNNYCLLILEIIKRHEIIINDLDFSIINQFYLKVKTGEKLNMIIKNNYLNIKKMEKCICIEFLYDKIDLPCKLDIKNNNNDIITNITYTRIESGPSYIHSIQSFIDEFPDFRQYSKKVDDILDLEEKVQLNKALNAYFKDLRQLVKNEKIVSRFSIEELETITYELENYILFKLYDKLFPRESTKTDRKFFKKCSRLNFIKPENLIREKKKINEELWRISMQLINEMDQKFTPFDKINNFGKAFSILQNSITFSSGKNDLGIDDTISTLIYVMLKSKPKNIFSNSKYCQLFLNPVLSKSQYGIIISQMDMVKNIIYNMKHTDLIGVTEQQFGKDEE